MLEKKEDKLNHKNFVERAQGAHGQKYDYSYVKYQGASRRVKILCPKHGLFEQTPSNHVKGKGCPFCEKGQFTRAEFIESANEVHKYSYDYTRCAYTQFSRKSEYLTVSCRKHGDFLVRPDQHLSGRGCPKCDKESNKLVKPKTLTSYSSHPVWTRIITVNSEVIAISEAGTFNNRKEAVAFIEKSKILAELADATLVETEIIEKRGTMINWESASKLIKTLGIKSHDSYLVWWDENQPDYVPRDLNEYFPYANKLYTTFIETAA